MATAAAADPNTVTIFYAGSGLAIVLAAITIAGWKHKALVYGLLGLAVLMFALAFTWRGIAAAAPAVGTALTALARSDVVWFLAIFITLGITAITQRRIWRIQSLDEARVIALFEERVLTARPAPPPASKPAQESVSRKVELLGRYVISLELERRRQMALDTLGRLRERHNGYVSSTNQRDEDYNRPLERGLAAVATLAPQIGYQIDQSAMQRQADAIRSDAKYLMVEDGEKDRWQSGGQKREWHLQDARIRYFEGLFGQPPEGFVDARQLKDEWDRHDAAQ